MAKNVVILSGISGSGKSSYVQTVKDSTVYTVSADYAFTDDSGVYKFDIKKLGEAHAECFRDFIDIMFHVNQVGEDDVTIIVDNTNLSTWEISPYMLGAAAFGFNAKIVTITPTNSNWALDDYLDTCARRNKHGLDRAAIYRQWDKLAHRNLPGYWNQERVEPAR